MRIIDADAMIPMMKYATTDSEIGVFPIKIGFDAIVEVINSQPTIEPEQKCGKWEEKAVSDEKVIDEWQSARCSACGKYHTAPYMYYFNNYNYCPNCGAKMI